MAENGRLFALEYCLRWREGAHITLSMQKIGPGLRYSANENWRPSAFAQGRQFQLRRGCQPLQLLLGSAPACTMQRLKVQKHVFAWTVNVIRKFGVNISVSPPDARNLQTRRGRKCHVAPPPPNYNLREYGETQIHLIYSIAFLRFCTMKHAVNFDIISEEIT